MESSPLAAADTAPELSPTLRTQKARSFWDDAFYRFRHNWAGMAGLGVFILLCLAALFADQIAPYDYLHQDWNAILQPPSAAHLMGTDDVGRDVFSRVIFGGNFKLDCLAADHDFLCIQVFNGHAHAVFVVLAVRRL